MTTAVIISLCVLLLFAYLFDITASKTRIPTVVLLLSLGFILHLLADAFQIQLPDLSIVLPAIGTVGLILIVLEGALELELSKHKMPIIKNAAIMALVPLLLLSFIVAGVYSYINDCPLKTVLANVIPLSVISSAIAIPSARNLSQSLREFVTYESSLSDIIGVVFFNFVVLNSEIDGSTFGAFILQLISIIIFSFLATILLSFLLGKIRHHVKFIPIILMIILIYFIAKSFHLPALIFILLFGLFLSNTDLWSQIKFAHNLRPAIVKKEVHRFHGVIMEIAFLVRSLFFLLFGFSITAAEIFNPATIIWAIAICTVIYLIRLIFLKLLSIKDFSLVSMAPRGLITVLLFLSIPIEESLPFFNKALVVQIVVLSALIMMFSSIMSKKKLENSLAPSEVGAEHLG
jgi:NhaP-type Na+/H+ or K+/H+ antiporter